MAFETLLDWLKAARDARERELQSCIERIRTCDPSVRAWVRVAPQNPIGDGPLAGIPFGAKDIIDTAGLPTEFGSPIYKGRVTTTDAAIVRELRQRGAVLLGKTETAAFAYCTPAPTRNPRHPDHTPGGSSSGSAAAVAAGMVPVAIGTQTKGSVLRPASYCGITGFKASYGLLPMDGVLPCAHSLDTLGFFTRTPADMLALWDALGYSPDSNADAPLGVVEPIPEVDPAMETAFRQTLVKLRQAGASIQRVDVNDMLVKLDEAATTVMFYEAARFHRERYEAFGSRLADLANLVRDGLRLSTELYDDARRYIEACRTRVAELYKATPAILVPAATGPAPFGLASTGDPRLNSPWTALGAPAISVPMPVGDALPLGLQITARHGDDARVIRTAMRLHAMLG